MAGPFAALNSFAGSSGGNVLLDIGGAFLQDHFNRGASARQMAFQERMSSTAYQRAAKDLEAAGLNRVLALGNPASSPAGSSMPVSVPSLGQSATNARVAQATVAAQNEQAQLTRDNQVLTRANTAKAMAETENIAQQTRQSISQERLNDANAELTRLFQGKVPHEINELISRIGQQGASKSQLSELARMTGISADTMEVFRSLILGVQPLVKWASDKVGDFTRSTAKELDKGSLGGFIYHLLHDEKGRPILAPGGLPVLKDKLGIPYR